MLQQPLYESPEFADAKTLLNLIKKDKLIEFIIDNWLENDPKLVELYTKAKTTKKNYEENNKLIQTLKDYAKELWLTYDWTKERIFAHQINTAKEFGNAAMSYWLSRIDYAKSIMQAWKLINSYYRYAWPMDIYLNHAKIVNDFNRVKREKEEKENKVYNKVSKIKF